MEFTTLYVDVENLQDIAQHTIISRRKADLAREKAIAKDQETRKLKAKKQS